MLPCDINLLSGCTEELSGLVAGFTVAFPREEASLYGGGTALTFSL
jgi:hypothetical protein